MLCASSISADMGVLLGRLQVELTCGNVPFLPNITFDVDGHMLSLEPEDYILRVRARLLRWTSNLFNVLN